MPYTLDNFRLDYLREHIGELPHEELLKVLTPEERMKGLPAEERMKGLSVDESLKALSPEVIAAVLKHFKGSNGNS